jgi:hypothetical protein
MIIWVINAYRLIASMNIHRSNILHHWQDINHWLGMNSRYGHAADMMDLDQIIAKDWTQQRRFGTQSPSSRQGRKGLR